ncbi:MAG: hypothetical protein H6924_02100 [Alphaproteobacteria bacterium]|nr:hypothetical protein [Alphaproteobacteria bacterium]
MEVKAPPSWFHRIAALFLSLSSSGIAVALLFGAMFGLHWRLAGQFVAISLLVGALPALAIGMVLLKRKIRSLMAFMAFGSIVAVFCVSAALAVATGDTNILQALPIGCLFGIPSGVVGGGAAWSYLRFLGFFGST